MKDTLITACSVVAVIVLSVGIGELALLGHQAGHVVQQAVEASR